MLACLAAFWFHPHHLLATTTTQLEFDQKAGGQRLSAPEVPLVTCRLIALVHKLIKKEHSYYQKGTHQKGTLIL